MATQQRAWTVTVSWPETGQDLDLYVTLSAGGQTTSGIGWNNGSQTPVLEVNSGGINGTFYAKWGGDNTQVGGHETITIYFNGTLPAGHTQVATVTPHCNYYHKLGSGDSAVDSTGAATITVDNQSGTWTVSEPSQHYGTRATASDPSVDVPLYADGGTPTPFPDLMTVTLNANGGSVNPQKIYYLDPTTSTTYGTLPTPTFAGCSFLGWFTSSTGGTQVTDTSYLATTASHALYAHWETHIQVVAFKSVGRVTLNGIPGDDIPDPWTVVSADIPVGDSVTITATPIDPNVHPFKAWYLNPSGWGSPEQTGTLVSGAGATYTFTASASATYFATFESGGSVVVSTTPSEAQPEAKVSINGQTNNTYEYSLDVPTGSTVTVSASERGGQLPFPNLTMYYFEGWLDNDPDSPTYGTTLSTDRVYTFQLEVKQGYSGLYSYANLLAQYAEFEQIGTEVMPDVAMGSISASLTPKDGEWFPLWSEVTFTATPSRHYRFVKWTEFRKTTGFESDYSTNNQITFEVGTQPFGVVFRAYFEWDGTDLLVNSANLGSPVQLVYDPATNKLVADF